MKSTRENEISENLLLLFPLIKRLFRGDAADPALLPFRNQTYHILRVLEKHGPLPMSEIGKRLFIAKQNMTTLTDRLTDDGLVERKDDARDRRITNIVITDRGRQFLESAWGGMKGLIQTNLSQLSDSDVEALQKALQTIKTVVSKIQGS